MIIVPLAIIAALDECMLSVDMEKIAALRALKEWPPIKLYPKNKQGYYVIDDGHHRVMATLLDRGSRIDAELVAAAPFELSWRWPRIAPVAMTGELLTACGMR